MSNPYVFCSYIGGDDFKKLFNYGPESIAKNPLGAVMSKSLLITCP